MNIELQSDLTDQVLALTTDYGYAPGEIISIGIALATVLLKERKVGNRVMVVDSKGRRVAEFLEPEPQAIKDIAKEYILSICPQMTGSSAALLVATLELVRDLEARPRT